MPTNQLQIKVNGIASVNLYDLSPEFYTERHDHESWELVYIDSGEICCNTVGKDITLKQGDVIFHKPYSSHKTSFNGKISAAMFSIIFDIDSPSMEFFKEKHIRVPAKLMPTLKNLINECNKTFLVSEHPLSLRENAPLGGEQLSILYLEEFLLLMLRDGLKGEAVEIDSPETEEASALVEDICKYLSENVYNKITLKDITEKFHFGKSYLFEQFKKYKGTAIMNYYLNLKLSEAKRLLREQPITIGQISEKLGFESPEYFSRYFKNRVGYSPRDFRKTLINSASLKRFDK